MPGVAYAMICIEQAQNLKEYFHRWQNDLCFPEKIPPHYGHYWNELKGLAGGASSFGVAKMAQ
jgi:hypothetical protein